MEGAERNLKIFPPRRINLQFAGPVDMESANSYIALTAGSGGVGTVAGLTPMLQHWCM